MSAADEIALRVAVRSILLSDSALSARLGEGYVVDDAGPASAMPYIAFGDGKLRDWSTTSERGSEHILVLDVWSRHRGAGEGLEVADLIERALANAVLTAPGFGSTLLQLQSIETTRRDRRRISLTRLTYRVRVDEA